jgi:capsular exopolysaccharide synthesis family protein
MPRAVSKFFEALEQARRDQAMDASAADWHGARHRGATTATVPDHAEEARFPTTPRSQEASSEDYAGLDTRLSLITQRLRLLLNGAAPQSDALRALMVVGCRASTGTTTTAALLARTLAEENRRRVLLVDANLRKPALDILFGVSNRSGLCNVVSEGAHRDAPIHETRWPNVSLLTAGRFRASPEAVFEDKRFDQLLSDLKQKFDLVIFDCAPLLEFPDAHGLAPKVDGVVLVVEAERTPVHDAQQAKRDLELAGGRLIGAVLNRERDYIPRVLRSLSRWRPGADR